MSVVPAMGDGVDGGPRGAAGGPLFCLPWVACVASPKVVDSASLKPRGSPCTFIVVTASVNVATQNLKVPQL